MTTSRRSGDQPEPPQGGSSEPHSEGSMNAERQRNVEADLAALLDDEVIAAETGGVQAEKRSPDQVGAATDGSHSAVGAVDESQQIDVPKPVPEGPESPFADSIDMPPSVESAQPVASEQEPEPPPEPKPLVTKRFGAILMDSVPSAADGSEAVPGEDVLPSLVEGREVAPSGPGGAPVEKPLPLVERTDDQKAIIINRLSETLGTEWQRTLHEQIDGLYKQVATEFSSPPEKAERALSMLREARQTLLETPEEYVTAEYRTLQVRAMLDRTRESRKQSQIYGPRILGYQLSWIVLFLLGLVFGTPLAGWVSFLGNMPQASLNEIFPVWNSMMWGGIGGVIGALYHLWWHISDRQDFDRNYLMWYWVQPVMGMVLGGIVFLILAGGFLVLQVNLTDDNASTAARLLPYLTAVLGGFRQNFVYEQFDRLIRLFTPASGRKEARDDDTDTT